MHRNILLLADSSKGAGIGSCRTIDGIIALRCRTRKELLLRLIQPGACAVLLKITVRGEFTAGFIQELRQAHDEVPVIVLGSARLELDARKAGIAAFFTDCSDAFFRRVVLGIMIKSFGKGKNHKGRFSHESACC